jgi:fibronectin-binding autotransporter adhesin
MKILLLGLFALFWSNLAIGQTLYTFNGGGTSGNWEDSNTWTTDPTGSTSVGGRVPGSNDNVVITNSFVVLLNSNIVAANLTINVQRGGVLDLANASAGFSNTLTRLAGQGTLRIARPYFPLVATNDFDDANTGTVEFYNWPAGSTALPLPSSKQYNNLRLLNTTATAYAAQLDSDLTLTGSLTLTRTNGAAVTLNIGKTASANRTLAVQGAITVGAGTFLGVSAVAGSHLLNVGGSFINNGTVRLHNGNVTKDDSQVALLSFMGATDANFACNGPTFLGRLQVNKGIDSQVLLNVTSSVRQDSAKADGNLHLSYYGKGDILILVNGVTKLGNNVYLPKIHNYNPGDLTNSAGWFQLGSSATSPTLWVAGGAVFNNNANAGLFVVYGTYRISGGSLSSMCDGGMVVREDGQVLIEGGTTSVNKFRPSSTSYAHRGSFII